MQGGLAAAALVVAAVAAAVVAAGDSCQCVEDLDEPTRGDPTVVGEQQPVESACWRCQSLLQLNNALVVQLVCAQVDRGQATVGDERE